MATKLEVDAFLQELKQKIEVFEIAYRPRSVNVQSLADLDMTGTERDSIIKNLSSEDYFSGPNNDVINPGLPDYYEFGVIRKGIEIYIKLNKGRPNKAVDCMSFHIAKFPITYPF